MGINMRICDTDAVTTDELLRYLPDSKFSREIKLLRNQWVSIKDKLPEVGVFVLLWNGHWRGVGRYCGDDVEDDVERWQDETTEYITPEPTHWMALPAPPAE